MCVPKCLPISLLMNCVVFLDNINEDFKLTNNSGGPSSASSPDCSSPILLKSQTCKRLSVPLDAKIVSLWGDHCTYNYERLC